jgi:hypothetical protein
MSESEEQQEPSSSIFILKTSPTGMKAPETFLRNRNWQVASSNNLREALAFIVQKHPQVVMIAADHPNKKVRTLPKLLIQAFPVRIIAFAEHQNGAAVAALHEMGMEYSIFPPVSGPAIERMILKIKKDDEKRARDEQSRLQTGPSGDSGNAENPGGSGYMRVGGSGFSEDQFKGSFEAARAALHQLVSSEGESALNNISNDLTPSVSSASSASPGGFYPQQDSSPSAKQSGIAYMPNQDSFFDPQSSSSWDPTTSGGASSTHSTTGATGGMGTPPTASGIDSGSGTSTTSSATPPSGASGANSSMGTSPTASGASSASSASATSSAGSKESAGIRKRGKKIPIYQYDSAPEPNQSLFHRGAQVALDKSVNKGVDNSKIQPVEQTTNVACIVINSPRFSGYLIAALGKNRQFDKEFMETVRSRLVDFLRSNGEMIKDNDESLKLDIQQVPFTDWALEKAEFLKKSVHNGDEIAMAFFPTKDTETKLEDSVTDKMVKIAIDDLKDDVPLEFDIYIYMPENNKFLLYTPIGRALQKDQKHRLKERGILHMHLRKEAIPDVKKYKAQNFLNETIDQFLGKKV